MSLTAAGYTAPRTADFLTVIRNSFEAAVGVEVDWSSNAFLYHITSIMSNQLGQTSEGSQLVYDAWVRSNASGIPLDDLGLIVGVPRIEATQSTYDAFTLTGDATSAGKVVEAGTQFEGGDTGNPVARWTLDADVILNGVTPVVGAITAVDFGAVAADAGTITTIVNPADGLASVTNAARVSEGVALELDGPYRLRQQSSLQITGGRSLNALRANLMALDGVTAAGVIDNDEGFAQTIEGLLMDPHSTAVTIAPSTLTTAQQQAAAELIYSQVPWGIKTLGTETFTVIGGDGFNKSIAFYFAADIAITVVSVLTVTAGMSAADKAAVIANVEAAIIAYFDLLGVSDDVLYHKVSQAISTVAGIVSFTLTLNGGAVNIPIGVSETSDLVTPMTVTAP